MFYPLVQEIAYQDPIGFLPLAGKYADTTFLDTTSIMPDCGRYSFLGVDPFQVLTSKGNQIELNGKKQAGNPFSILKEELAKFSLEFHDMEIPFQGGVAGYFGYDLYSHLESSIPVGKMSSPFPDMAIGFYDVVLAFDHVKKQAWIFSSGFPFVDEMNRKERAKERCQWLLNEISNVMSLKLISEEIVQAGAIQSNFSLETYCEAVNKVKEYILAGDIFEANISQKFSAFLPQSLSTLDLYRRLRLLNPAPFSAYLDFGGVTIISASPERFLKLNQGNVETRPIKGTRRRDQNKIKDESLAKELLESEKDRSENIMIVDLLRNDLSRVCRDFSVKVPQLCGLESYATVHHLVSVVTGQLQESLSAVDLLCATFPGGSITGAPKIRAMEIISEIESVDRGPYCGAAGYIGFNGDMDTSILIRSFAVKEGVVTFQAGGAVVIDSDPESEYEETLTKSNALRRALCESVVD